MPWTLYNILSLTPHNSLNYGDPRKYDGPCFIIIILKNLDFQNS